MRFNQVESHPTLPLRAVGKGQVRDAVPVASLSLSTKATKLPTKLATKLMKALKGRDIPAQGNALGNGAKYRQALKGRDIVQGTRRRSTGCKPLSLVVSCRRVPGTFLQKCASTGRATPSRLAAAMERGSVGQTFLSALVDVRRQECPRHSGAAPARLIGCGIGGVGGTVHKASEKYPLAPHSYSHP